MHKDGWNVTTSQRRDVPTSRRWVNIYKSQQAATSRRLNVATLQHHDVSASYASQSLKEKGDQNSEGDGRSRTYELGHMEIITAVGL